MFGTPVEAEALLPKASVRAPWLRRPAGWRALTVAAQRSDPRSVLSLHHAALHLRRTGVDGALAWLDAPARVLALRRGARCACLVNLSDAAVPVAAYGSPLLASGPLSDGLLPPDTAAWFRPA